MGNWFEKLQSIGKALMLPIAVLPAAALLLRLGAPDVLNIPFITNAGGAVFDNLALIFAATLYYFMRRFRWTPRPRAAPYVFRCSVCGHVYLDRRNVPMAACGQCGNMNECVKSF